MKRFDAPDGDHSGMKPSDDGDFVRVDEVAPLIDSLRAELEYARTGRVFLTGSMNEFAMIAKPVLEWDCLTAMTYLPGNKQYGYASQVEDFRREAVKVLVVKGELDSVIQPSKAVRKLV